DVLVDALFAPSRTRTQRVRRAARAAQEAIEAARLAGQEGDPSRQMSALVATSMSAGRSAREARLAVLRPRVQPPAAHENGSNGLAPQQRQAFDRDGFVHIRHAFDGAAEMEDRMWAFFERRGIDRRRPSTWPTGNARHLQKLLR